MVILNSPCPLNSRFHSFLSSSGATTTTPFIFTHRHRQLPPPISSFSICSQLYNHQQTPSPTTTPTSHRIDKSLLDVSEAHSDSELWAAACLRVRSFYDFPEQSFGIQLSNEGESRAVVGTLDLNQCIRLPQEITGMKPKGIGADFARAYISNVCVAKELHRNGLGYSLIAKSKMVAEEWVKISLGYGRVRTTC